MIKLIKLLFETEDLKMDMYKARVLAEMLNEMEKDEHYLCRLKGGDTHSINIEKKVIEILIQYYCIFQKE